MLRNLVRRIFGGSRDDKRRLLAAVPELTTEYKRLANQRSGLERKRDTVDGQIRDVDAQRYGVSRAIHVATNEARNSLLSGCDDPALLSEREELRRLKQTLGQAILLRRRDIQLLDAALSTNANAIQRARSLEDGQSNLQHAEAARERLLRQRDAAIRGLERVSRNQLAAMAELDALNDRIVAA